MKQPAFQFYTGDWMKSPDLSMCSPATRGIWVDLLCAMHERNRSGEVSGTVEQLARICRCTREEMEAALEELDATKTAEISRASDEVLTVGKEKPNDADFFDCHALKRPCHGVVTVKCRRMVAEFRLRKSAAVRQKRKRTDGVPPVSRPESRPCHASVTQKSRSYSSSSDEEVVVNTPTSSARTSDAERIVWTLADGFQNVTETDRKKWAVAYPAIDIDRQLAAADAWLRANPKKAVKSNWARFLINWFSREQDRGGDTRSGPRTAGTANEGTRHAPNGRNVHRV